MAACGRPQGGCRRGPLSSAPLLLLIAPLALLLLAPLASACLSSCSSDYKPVCRDGKMWYNPCHLECEMGAVPYTDCTMPPVKPPKPGCDPLSHPYKTLTYYNPRDCRNYTLFDLDASCMPNWATAKKVCERRGLELAPEGEEASMDGLHHLCSKNRFTCWMGGKCDPGLCYLMSQEGFTLKQGCEQPVRFVCRTKNGKCPKRSPPPPSPRPPSPKKQSCLDKCDATYPNWNVWVCDKDNRAYKNWCYAACHECDWYTPCEPGQPGQPKGDNILQLYYGGYDYRLYTVDAKQRMWHLKAEKFCKALGKGWDMVPYHEKNGLDALRQLCAKNRYTCWCKRAEDDKQCTLMDAEGVLQKQGCEQDVRFVCRKKRA